MKKLIKTATFLPITKEEVLKDGGFKLDVILVSGDAYIDSPYIGIAVIGRVLEKEGFRVGIIPQPTSKEEIEELGEPLLFWGVSGGSVDSMIANYTALKKRRSDDDYTPLGINNKRPNRASIVYTNLIRSSFKKTKPIVLGGIEASLRRVAHYDFWSDSVKRSILFDAKADYLIYGMAERSVVEFANAIKNKENPKDIRGICYIESKLEKLEEDSILLPSFEEVSDNKDKFLDAFNIFYNNNDPFYAKKLIQKHSNRYLIQNPPQYPLNQSELDSVFALPFQRDAHPKHQKEGAIKALDTIKFSITTHYGCYGECSFCSIALHQGRIVSSRSENSIIDEVKKLTELKGFKGVIQDVGGASANMYGYECDKKLKAGACENRACIGANSCKKLKPNHKKNIELLRKIRGINRVKKVFVASGIRYDLIEDDKRYGDEYLKEIVEHHISGQLRVAPEHTSNRVLSVMNKPKSERLLRFKSKFESLNRGKKQFLTYYYIAAHPGCDMDDMHSLKEFAKKELKSNPKSVQIFTPSPSTYATTIYYCGKDPKTKKSIFVERDINKKRAQKDMLY